jgi:hypothetical protein
MSGSPAQVTGTGRINPTVGDDNLPSSFIRVNGGQEKAYRGIQGLRGLSRRGEISEDHYRTN